MRVQSVIGILLVVVGLLSLALGAITYPDGKKCSMSGRPS